MSSERYPEQVDPTIAAACPWELPPDIDFRLRFEPDTLTQAEWGVISMRDQYELDALERIGDPLEVAPTDEETAEQVRFLTARMRDVGDVPTPYFDSFTLRADGTLVRPSSGDRPSLTSRVRGFVDALRCARFLRGVAAVDWGEVQLPSSAEIDTTRDLW